MTTLREKNSLADSIKEQTGLQADNDNTRAFMDGIAAQERMGREALQREQKALEEMQSHLDLVARFLAGKLTEADQKHPGIHQLIAQRQAALSAALRGHKR